MTSLPRYVLRPQDGKFIIWDTLLLKQVGEPRDYQSDAQEIADNMSSAARGAAALAELDADLEAEAREHQRDRQFLGLYP